MYVPAVVSLQVPETPVWSGPGLQCCFPQFTVTVRVHGTSRRSIDLSLIVTVMPLTTGVGIIAVGAVFEETALTVRMGGMRVRTDRVGYLNNHEVVAGFSIRA